MAWAYLLVGRGDWWQADQRLPPPKGPLPDAGEWPSVAVVVPARDEATVLPGALPSLLRQEYPGHAWVVLVDDESADSTAEVARQLAIQGGGRGLGLSIVPGTPRPEGWAGKPWAMEQGVRHAMASARPPEWLLFTDADIRHPLSSLRELVGAAVAGQRCAVSVMARLSTATGWERVVVPAFVYFFTQLYPFPRVNDPARRTAAAAGGCLLVNAGTLRSAGGIASIGWATIDDVALAKRLKSAGADIWLGLAAPAPRPGPGQGPGHGHGPEAGLAVESSRVYPGLAELWDMVARNAYTQLGHNPLALLGTVAGLATVYISPPLLVVAGAYRRRPLAVLAGACAWAAMATTYRPTVRYYGGRSAAQWALPFTAALYGGMTVASAVRHYRGTSTWKGRTQGR